MARVETGKVVMVHYKLTGEDGTLIESSQGKSGLVFLQGYGEIPAALERAIEGAEVGSSPTVTLAPEDAYGALKGDGPVAVHRREFPRDVTPVQGRPLQINGKDGKKVIVWVTKVQGSRVWIDSNHPLAGQTLTYALEILAVRDAMAEEISHGHAHGQDGWAKH